MLTSSGDQLLPYGSFGCDHSGAEIFGSDLQSLWSHSVYRNGNNEIRNGNLYICLTKVEFVQEEEKRRSEEKAGEDKKKIRKRNEREEKRKRK